MNTYSYITSIIECVLSIRPAIDTYEYTINDIHTFK